MLRAGGGRQKERREEKMQLKVIECYNDRG
jgi:hypothetical protein